MLLAAEDTPLLAQDRDRKDKPREDVEIFASRAIQQRYYGKSSAKILTLTGQHEPEGGRNYRTFLGRNIDRVSTQELSFSSNFYMRENKLCPSNE